MRKHWDDYLWIGELLYLILGLFNILFAWLGMLFSPSRCWWLSLAGARLTAAATAAGGSSSPFWGRSGSSPAMRRLPGFYGAGGFDTDF